MRENDNTIIQIAVQSNNLNIVKIICQFIYKKEDLSNKKAKSGRKLSGTIDAIVNKKMLLKEWINTCPVSEFEETLPCL